METLIHLDTHTAIWLYAGKLNIFNSKIIKLLENNSLCISYMARLEMQFLYEVGKIKLEPTDIIKGLMEEIDLIFSENNISSIMDKAIEFNFTRDPFDRIIVADAAIDNSKLITKDQIILDNYKNAIWD